VHASPYRNLKAPVKPGENPFSGWIKPESLSYHLFKNSIYLDSLTS
jgi:hypothetical protein